MNTVPSAQPTSQWQLAARLAGPAYLPNIAGTIAWGMLIPTLPLYLAQQGVSIELTGVILGATGLGALFGGLPAGSLNSRVGEYRTLAVGLGWLALSTALLGVTDTAIALVVLRMIFGGAFVATRLSRHTWVTRNVDVSMRGRAMAIFGGSSRLSALIGPTLGGVLADTIGFAATFVVAAGLTVLGIVPATLARRHEPPSALPSDAPRRGVLQAVRKHRRLLLRAAFIPFLVMAIREARQVLLPLVGDTLELSATVVGVIVSISAAADLLLFPVAGSLSDRLGRLWSMVPAFGLVAVGLLFLGIAAAQGSIGLVIAAGVVIGIGNGLSAGSMLTLGSDLAPADDTPAFLAAISTAQESGRFAGALGVGLVAGATSLAGASFVFAAVTLAMVVSLVRVVGDTRAVASKNAAASSAQ